MVGQKTRVIRFGVVATLLACTLGAGAVPSFAQTNPAGGRWSSGPGAAGDNTYVGRIEAPRASQTIGPGANVLVTGWAADTTARGWAGFDALEVWSGDKDASTGRKLASGTVGLTRPDMGDAMGTMTFARSGFNAVVPASVLSSLGPGAQSINVYLHTPAKGWWHRSVSVNLSEAKATATEEPTNVFLRPLDNTIISQKQKFEKYSLYGYALDQTPITDPLNQTLGSCECGISSVTIYVDSIDKDHNLGSAALGALIAFANKGKPASQSIDDFSPVSREYGDQYDKAGWAFSINPRTLSADWHTFYAVARSSITGKTSTASVTMFIKDTPEDGKIIAP